MRETRFIFPGEPRAIQSVRSSSAGGFIRHYQPKKNTEWKAYIKLMALEQLPKGAGLKTGALAVEAKFYFPPPKSWPKWRLNALRAGARIYKTTKPDLPDNLMKGVTDALTGVVWRDDALICRVISSKEYSFSPRIEMKVIELEGDI